jgi:phosphoglycolate phosphatase
MKRSDPRYHLIVFDWDGTLMDSASGIVACIQEASRDMGLEVPSSERASHVIGLGLRDSLRLAVPDLPESAYAQFAELYRKHFLAREEGMDLFPGVRDLVAGLHASGYALAVATGKSRRGLDRALGASGLAEYFCASRCADETNPKPHPAMLLELMSELSRGPAEMLMVGDTSHDLDMAASAAVDAVAVTYGAHPADLLKARAPKGVVGSIQELREWLMTHA